MPRTENETKQSQFRLSRETLAELDTIADWLSSTSGRPPTRTDAIRYAAKEMAKRAKKRAKTL